MSERLKKLLVPSGIFVGAVLGVVMMLNSGASAENTSPKNSVDTSTARILLDSTTIFVPSSDGEPSLVTMGSSSEEETLRHILSDPQCVNVADLSAPNAFRAFLHFAQENGEDFSVTKGRLVAVSHDGGKTWELHSYSDFIVDGDNQWVYLDDRFCEKKSR